MNIQELDHEHFEAVKALAEIGTKISAGKAELDSLEASKKDFLNERAEDTIQRVARVLEESKELLAELGGYHSELVGFRNSIDGYVVDIRELIQAVEHWKASFDAEAAEKNKEFDKKSEENATVLAEIKRNRALLAGESEGIKTQRKALRDEAVKIKDEWAAIERAAEEINGKK